MSEKYKLEVSVEQAEILKIALEEYFRLRMNQTFDFADSICFEDFDSKNFTSEEFDKRIRDRDILKEELDKLLNKMHPLQLIGGRYRERTIEMKRAQEIWQVIRHALWIDRHGNEDSWCVDAREPMCMSVEPLPRMEKIENV